MSRRRTSRAECAWRWIPLTITYVCPLYKEPMSINYCGMVTVWGTASSHLSIKVSYIWPTGGCLRQVSLYSFYWSWTPLYGCPLLGHAYRHTWSPNKCTVWPACTCKSNWSALYTYVYSIYSFVSELTPCTCTHVAYLLHLLHAPLHYCIPTCAIVCVCGAVNFSSTRVELVTSTRVYSVKVVGRGMWVSSCLWRCGRRGKQGTGSAA